MTIDLPTFNDIFTTYWPRFVRFAASYLHDDAIAEDLFVESMMTFWQQRQSLPDNTNVPAYILRILQNKCIDHLRHLKVHEEYSEDRKRIHQWDLSTRISSLENFVPEEVMTREIEDIVIKTIATLSEETRQIFMLSLFPFPVSETSVNENTPQNPGW